VREELRPQKLTFTEIAKTVGERWQVLSPEEKEQYEVQAANAKELYNTELAKYKRTNHYRDYQNYLADFKARNSPSTTGGADLTPTQRARLIHAGSKKPKLETHISNASSSGGSVSTPIRGGSSEHLRKDSLSQSGYSPSSSSVTSPITMPRIVGDSRDTSSHSSLPSTPVNSQFMTTTTTATNTTPGIGPASRNYDSSRPNQLPRILPLDAQTPKPHLAPLIAEPGPLKENPRRSATHSPATFLRHETSKSSTSSNISGASSGSATFTPITPIDDTLSRRSLPPPTALLNKNPSGSQSLVDLGRLQTNSLAPVSTSDSGNIGPPPAIGKFPAGTQLAMKAYHLNKSLSTYFPSSNDRGRPQRLSEVKISFYTSRIHHSECSISRNAASYNK
jgi:hypothetical protein